MNTNTKKLGGLSRLLLILCCGMLVYALFVPLWLIDLDAPQYPEGLRLLIYPHKLGGNVEIINGLNHYIGMRELHSDDFPEFTILPYVIGAFALASLAVALIGRKKGLYILLTCFVLFGIVAMVDFYKWEYEYGHDLNPNAAIIVPGQAYQPPLIGFKQLLNFGAYSIPAAGGWMFVASGVLMVLSVLIEKNVFSRFRKPKVAVAALLPLFLLSCDGAGPEPIKLNKDNCEFCRMTIADARFSAQIVTKKGRVYKFDDLSCLQAYMSEKETQDAEAYVADYSKPEKFVVAEEAHYVTGGKVNSPMGGNMAAFGEQQAAAAFASQVDGELKSWQALAR